ncbi:MAG: helix-turn-helix transcriptional regulator [Anaerolineaceae bacterium]|nr:helix-turn-helix transcriptional regulator [Anaerolineaceae bacterium]
MSDKTNFDIGIRIRRRRKVLGFSMRELAEKANLTAGFIGQVEQGKSTPSLATLIRIAEALQAPMSTFLDNKFEQEGSTPPASVEQSSDTTKMPPQNRKLDMLYRDFGRKMEILRTRMLPGACAEVFPLDEPTEQIVYILEGELKITLTSGEHILRSGRFLYYDGNSLQKYEAFSDEEVVFLTVITPPVKRPRSRDPDQTTNM